MPRINITFAQVDLDMIDDDRWLYRCSESQQLLYIKLILLAGRLKNRIPNDYNFLAKRLNYQSTVEQLREDLHHLLAVYPGIVMQPNYLFFKRFWKRYSYVHPRLRGKDKNVLGSSKGNPKNTPRTPQEHPKGKEDKRIETKGKEVKPDKEDSVVTHIMKAYYLHTKDIRPWDKGKAEDFINQNPSMVTKLENAVQLKENWGKPMADIIAILKPKQAKPQDFVMSYGKIITCNLCGQSKNERDKVCKVCKNDPVLAEEVKGYKK